MSTNASRIEANLREVKKRIADAAKRVSRSPDSVRLIAVTKTVGIEEVRILHSLGQREFGENRVDGTEAKIRAHESTLIDNRPLWHMIGSIQRRKCRQIIELFDIVDSVDRVEVAEALNRRCEEVGKRLPVLIEVNASGEASKHGFSPEEVPAALEEMSRMPYLQPKGLMTMAPFETDPKATRPVFAAVRKLADDLGLQEVSMGMTNDFEVAVEEGSTQVRIGTMLFR